MRLTLLRLLVLSLLTLHAAACVPPDRGAAGRGATLAVGMAGRAAVAWLGDGYGWRETPLAGPPEHLASGPGGSVVALTTASGGSGRMELAVVRPARPATFHAAGPRLSVVETSGVARLATDGQRYAVVAYQRRLEARPPAGALSPADSARCPLLVVDLLTAESATKAAPCQVDERVRSLALEPAGDLEREGVQPASHAYVGLEDTRHRSVPVGRLMVLALPTGAIVDAVALSGTPVDLRLVPGSLGQAAALYVLEQAGGSDGVVPTPERGRVLVLDPLTLAVLSDHPLSAHASRLVPALDGRSVFLVQDDAVQRLDLATGRVRQIARLPGRVVAAEVFGDHLYLASPEARVLWVLDARTGFRQPDVRLAGHPVLLTAPRAMIIAPAGPTQRGG